MNIKDCLEVIAKWGGTLRYFPADAHARLGIAEEIGQMTGDIDRVRWLVSRVPKLYSEWPGIREVRAVYCASHKPDDGYEVYSGTYRDGIPSEKAPEPLQLAAGPRQIAAREEVDTLTAAESIRPVLRALSAAKAMGAPRRVHVPGIPVVQITDANRITEADIERARQELRGSK